MPNWCWLPKLVTFWFKWSERADGDDDDIGHSGCGSICHTWNVIGIEMLFIFSIQLADTLFFLNVYVCTLCTQCHSKPGVKPSGCFGDVKRHTTHYTLSGLRMRSSSVHWMWTNTTSTEWLQNEKPSKRSGKLKERMTESVCMWRGFVTDDGKQTGIKQPKEKQKYTVVVWLQSEICCTLKFIANILQRSTKKPRVCVSCKEMMYRDVERGKRIKLMSRFKKRKPTKKKKEEGNGSSLCTLASSISNVIHKKGNIVLQTVDVDVMLGWIFLYSAGMRCDKLRQR